MIEKITGIILQTIRHNERNNIVTLFTRQRGRMALISPVGTGKSAMRRRARLAPLALIETDVNVKAGRELQFLGDIATPSPWHNLYFDPVKGTLTLFMAEFLNSLLRSSDADEPMWRFLINSLASLDALDKGLSNFHIAFLIRLMPFAGIMPDVSTFRSGRYFNMQEGQFTDHHPLYPGFLMPEEAAVIPTLVRISYRNLHLFRFNVEQRRHILSILLKYYAVHLPVSEDLKSLDVLREVFGD